MDISKKESAWKDPLTWIVVVLALSVLLFMLSRFIPHKIEYDKPQPLNQTIGGTKDSLAIALLQNRINNVEKMFTQTRSDVVKICDDTLSISRDVVGLMALLLGLVSIAGIYKIKSLENMLRSELDQHVKASLSTLSKEVNDGIEEIRKNKQYFEYIRRLWSGDNKKIMMTADYLYGQYHAFIRDPYTMDQLRRALVTIPEHKIRARLLRILVMLDEPNALDDMIHQYHQAPATDRNQYRLALRGLVSDSIDGVEGRLRREGLWHEIMDYPSSNESS